MSVEVIIRASFASNKEAQRFSGWLYFNGYNDKTLFLNSVETRLFGHGERVVVLEHLHACGGKILEDLVHDDDDLT